MKVKFTLVEVEDTSFRLFINFAGKTTNMAIIGKRHFYSLETLSFYLEHQQTQFLGLFRPKINIDEISIFELNPWINQLFWKNHKYGDSGKTTIREKLRPKANAISSVF